MSSNQAPQLNTMTSPSCPSLSVITRGSPSPSASHKPTNSFGYHAGFPSRRHAGPYAPWPWIDISDQNLSSFITAGRTAPGRGKCKHEADDLCICWKEYPRSYFPNWTKFQRIKAGISSVIEGEGYTGECTIHLCDVVKDGVFEDPGPLTTNNQNPEEVWRKIMHASGSPETPENLLLRAMFVDNMSGPVLQMLGARFKIEPFFFSSSLKWIPSRFQEEIVQGVGDHITVTIPFIKSVPMLNTPVSVSHQSGRGKEHSASTLPTTTGVDTQEPLGLGLVKKSLVLDLLSFHLVRNINGSTLISFHPSSGPSTTTAEDMQIRARCAGQSVYWQNIFQKAHDPTLVLICFIWHAVYAWDEALESLYQHILLLENMDISRTSKVKTNELHRIRAHHMHYSSLLDELVKNIDFIRETENPFMTVHNYPIDVLMENKTFIARECKNLEQKIQQFKEELHLQERRLENIMNLVDSTYTRELAEAAVRDSAAMKQVAYLTMVFLPASLVATLFGMNVSQLSPDTLGTMRQYFGVAVPLTLVTIWIILSSPTGPIFNRLGVRDDENSAEDEVWDRMRRSKVWFRLAWPVVLFWQRILRRCWRKIASKFQESYTISVVDHDLESQNHSVDMVQVDPEKGLTAVSIHDV